MLKKYGEIIIIILLATVIAPLTAKALMPTIIQVTDAQNDAFLSNVMVRLYETTGREKFRGYTNFNGMVDVGNVVTNAALTIYDLSRIGYKNLRGSKVFEPGVTSSFKMQTSIFCGDGVCSTTETFANCPKDCSRCGDSICTQPPEDRFSCSSDCSCKTEGKCATNSDCPQGSSCVGYSPEFNACGICSNPATACLAGNRQLGQSCDNYNQCANPITDCLMPANCPSTGCHGRCEAYDQPVGCGSFFNPPSGITYQTCLSTLDCGAGYVCNYSIDANRLCAVYPPQNGNCCPSLCTADINGEFNACNICNNNGVCNAGENFANCPGDCHCGNGRCDYGESQKTCSKDCGTIISVPAVN